MNHRPKRDTAYRKSIPNTDLRLLPRLNLAPYFEGDRSDDVPLRPVRVVKKGDPRRPVRVVFSRDNACRNSIFVTSEIYDAVVALVSTTTETHGDLPAMVSPSLPRQRAQEALLGCDRGQLAKIGKLGMATSR
jgi:hypothetical protein